MSFGKGGIYMAYERYPELNNEFLHDLAIEYLKINFNGRTPSVATFFKKYISVRNELIEQHTKLYSEFATEHIKNNY